MCYHEARSAWFIGHCWGRGWRDATQNLLQTSIISRLDCLLLRRLCDTQKVQLLSVCFRWRGGQWRVGEGYRLKTNKQKLWAQVRQRHSHDDLRIKLTRVISLFPKQEPVQKKRTMAAYEPVHVIIQTLSSKSVDT